MLWVKLAPSKIVSALYIPAKSALTKLAYASVLPEMSTLSSLAPVRSAYERSRLRISQQLC
eukprot:6175434-Pleurochrysis_carterae.AAC.3